MLGSGVDFMGNGVQLEKGRKNKKNVGKNFGGNTVHCTVFQRGRQVTQTSVTALRGAVGVKIDRGGSLSSHILASPSKEKGNSNNLTVVLGTSECLNVDVTLLKKRRWLCGSCLLVNWHFRMSKRGCDFIEETKMVMWVLSSGELVRLNEIDECLL
nr:hypothetical protein [Tanacetum cinerariifolium]